MPNSYGIDKKITPKGIFSDYDAEKSYKDSIGERGLYEQTKMNERFLLGEHWKGAQVGDMPVIVMNVIKQITDYQISNIVSNPTGAIYSFEGIDTDLSAENKGNIDNIKSKLDSANPLELMTTESQPITIEDELNAVADALSSHSRSVWERAKMDSKNQTGVRKAAISGTYVLYSNFDSNLTTGLKVAGKPVKGDISPEILDITNVYFGEPTYCEVQCQPYIIIAQRKRMNEVKREALNNGVQQNDIDKITADSDSGYDAGNVERDESDKNSKTTVLTMFWKEYKENGDFTVYGIKVCKEVVIREKWDTKRQLYPISIFQWDERDNCIYGHSEITEMIPNQISINRMISLEILCAMLTGMPKIIVNRSKLQSEISNAPGEILEVDGTDDVHNSVTYLNPGQITPNWDRVQQNLIDNTKIIAGATQAALGDMRPENTSAIIALREAAALPLQTKQNRFYSFVEDTLRIWGEMFLKNYGKRYLKISKDGRTLYVPFNGDKYVDYLLNVKIEVGPSTLWSVSTVIATLTNLLTLGKIGIVDFLERIPDGYIEKKQELIDKLRSIEEENRQMDMQMKQAQIQQQQSQQPINPNNVYDGLTDEELQAAQERPDIVQSVLNGQQATA